MCKIQTYSVCKIHQQKGTVSSYSTMAEHEVSEMIYSNGLSAEIVSRMNFEAVNIRIGCDDFRIIKN